MELYIKYIGIALFSLVFMQNLSFCNAKQEQDQLQHTQNRQQIQPKMEQLDNEGIPSRSAVNMPSKRAFSEELMNSLSLPEGFKINVFAKNLINPRMLYITSDGKVYVTQPDDNSVVMLQDRDGDGVSDSKVNVVNNLDSVHGITISRGKIYLATPGNLYSAPLREDGSVNGRLKKLPPVFPAGGNHPNRTMAFGPDGMLYVSVGSSCNACVESSPDYATILKMEPDGSGKRIFAKGLRNTLGFAWHPETKEMWGMDQGSDWRGGDIPPEELNNIQDGKNYGWPWCFNKRQVDIMMKGTPENLSKEEYCKKTDPAILAIQAHSSPIGFIFYTGKKFPQEYRNDAFLTLRGSWNRQPATGYKIVRIKFEDGKPTHYEDFVTGFLINDGKEQFARLAGIGMFPDNSLLVADDQSGIIYRINYDGNSISE